MNITFQNMAKHCKYSVLYLLNTYDTNVCYFQSMYSGPLFWFFFSIYYFPWLYVPVGFVFCLSIFGGKNKFNACQFSQNWLWNKQTYIGSFCFIKLSLQTKKVFPLKSSTENALQCCARNFKILSQATSWTHHGYA